MSKVLIVEDEQSLRDALNRKFTQEGFEVVQAMDGEAGLAAALREKPAIILLDIVMHRMDGMTMLKKLREHDSWGKSVPVIILTNLSSADEERNGNLAALEPSYYLVKTDFSLEDVVRTVRERLEGDGTSAVPAA